MPKKNKENSKKYVITLEGIKEAIENNPEQLIGIKSNRVYSQIARTGRNPQKSTEQAILISALEHASEVKRINGETVRINPVYVPMKAKEIQLCFGRRIEQMPDSSFFVFEKSSWNDIIKIST